ncbi:UNVERIFIED_CONTAM: hypothetical protein HDU68_011804 [Siphonaria sp. JEL0065]|nr:hypothetical protein HDU68_011804 [Siphonaria sp. JEL0065]
MVIILALFALASFVSAYSGRISWYDSDWNTIGSIVACSEKYPPVNHRLFTAVSVFSLSDRSSGLNSGVCGRCIQVQGDNGSVMVTVVDVMMRDNARPQDLDLSTDAFIAVAGNLTVGIVDQVQWFWVDCESGGGNAATTTTTTNAVVRTTTTTTNVIAQTTTTTTDVAIPAKAAILKTTTTTTTDEVVQTTTTTTTVVVPTTTTTTTEEVVPVLTTTTTTTSENVDVITTTTTTTTSPIEPPTVVAPTRTQDPIQATGQPAQNFEQSQTSPSSETQPSETLTPRPTTFPTLRYNYTSCVADSVWKRLLPNALKQKDSGMTVDCCAKLAKAAGYSLFALEYSEECYGASSYAYDPTPSTKCNMPCKGNADEICGGRDALSVYTFSTFHYSGCFTDWADHPRVLKNLIRQSDSMTIETCAELAADQGFSLFGLEYGRECWADSMYQYYPSPTDTCNTPCKGSKDEICGGAGAIAVYSY